MPWATRSIKTPYPGQQGEYGNKRDTLDNSECNKRHTLGNKECNKHHDLGNKESNKRHTLGNSECNKRHTLGNLKFIKNIIILFKSLLVSSTLIVE